MSGRGLNVALIAAPSTGSTPHRQAASYGIMALFTIYLCTTIMTMRKKLALPLLTLTLAGWMAVAALVAWPQGRALSQDETSVYLPITQNSYCWGFNDEFDDPSSGWFVGDDDVFGDGSSYASGEYRIGGLKFAVRESPGCWAENYSIETEVRLLFDTPGRFYGIAFGVVDEVSPVYAFVIFPNPHEEEQGPSYVLLYTSPTDIEDSVELASGESALIAPDNGANVLHVVRDGSNITVSINGSQVASVTDTRITGVAGIALLAGIDPRQAGSYNAGFEYFHMQALP